MATPEIFQRLKQDHDQHRRLLQKLDATQGDSGERQKLFEQLRIEVTAHAAAEEESLYATMLAKPELREDAQHSVSEHKEIDDYIEELEGIDMASPAWLTKFREMKKRYTHHIDEEEQEMFPDAAKALTDKEEARLAETFKNRKPAELAHAEEHGGEHDQRD